MIILTRNILRNLIKLQRLLLKQLYRTQVECSTNKCVQIQQEIPINVENPREDAKNVLNKQITVTVIPGDGAGPELIKSVEEVFMASNVPVQFDCFSLPTKMPLMNMTYEQVRDSIAKNGVCLKGSFSKIPKEYQRTIQRRLCLDLDLYASVVHTKSLPGLKVGRQNVDIVVIREYSENEEADVQNKSRRQILDHMKETTIRKSDRIAEFAFEYARANQRKKVTAIHKCSIMKLSDGLFLRSCEKISNLYPGIKFEKMIIDTAVANILSRPSQFDVLVTPNLYGKILNNVASELVGGSGVVPKVVCSRKQVLFESVSSKKHDSATNPIGMLLGAVKLLDHLNLKKKAEIIRDAILKVIAEGKIKTKDLGGNASTREFTNAVTSSMDLANCE